MSTKILDERELCDLECLSIGAVAPLNSYMTQNQYEKCLMTLKISDPFERPTVAHVIHETELNQATMEVVDLVRPLCKM